MDRLTQEEIHQQLDEWINEETSNYQNKENARFQVSKSKTWGNHEMIHIIVL